MASAGLTVDKDGKLDSIVDTVFSSFLMTSHFLVLRTRPKSLEASIRNLKSSRTSSTDPHNVPSSE